jgi:hypothetical protein
MPVTPAHVDDNSRALVTQNRREEALRIRAGAREFVGVTYAGRLDLDQHFARPRPVQLHGLDHQRCACSMRDGSTNVHDSLR